MPQLSRAKVIVTSALVAVIALGFSYYVLLFCYLGFLLATSGQADTEPAQSPVFRRAALAISAVVALATFWLFYRRQTQMTQ
ncbi:MAG: hypothetical protein LAN37_09770 [Acidobacteriia bacterium]|nr:hypothetical protein [Terriglobia bacterium]